MKHLELTEEEIRVLVGMIDVAVRARGLEAAGSAVHLAAKIQNAPEVTPESDAGLTEGT